jgi:hypothetical protein
VSERERSMDFYRKLGFREIGQVTFGDGSALVMLNLAGDGEVVTLELVHNPALGAVPARQSLRTASLRAARRCVMSGMQATASSRVASMIWRDVRWQLILDVRRPAGFVGHHRDERHLSADTRPRARARESGVARSGAWTCGRSTP